MLRVAILFLVIALIAALLGFTRLAGREYPGAKLLFFVFLLICIISMIAGFSSRRVSV